MEVRIESMICLWDDEIPTLFLEFVNLLTFCQGEEELRRSVKEFPITFSASSSSPFPR